MKTLKFYMFILLFSSCLGQNKGENSRAIDNEESNFEITCFLVSLDGDKKIYQIKDRTIFFPALKEDLDKIAYQKLMEFPKGILEKDHQIGCGTCVDAVDYKFIFTINDKKSIWVIQPGQEIPEAYNEYFQLLIGYYEQAIRKY